MHSSKIFSSFIDDPYFSGTNSLVEPMLKTRGFVVTTTSSSTDGDLLSNAALR